MLSIHKAIDNIKLNKNEMISNASLNIAISISINHVNPVYLIHINSMN